MSISAYDFLAILRINNNDLKAEKETFADYLGVLESVRTSIARNHAQELGAILDDPRGESTLKQLISKYSAEYMAGLDYDRDTLIERIYQDMAGLGILTQYLQDPSIEEININAYNQIELVRATGTEFLEGPDAFPSKQAALDIVRRMVRMGGKLLDAQTPQVDSFIGSSTRISAKIPPIVPLKSGVTASIRMQSKARITKEMLISSGTATSDMLDFLSLCICNSISIGIGGSTGSGKSTMEAYIANSYITDNEDHNNRIYLIEDTQELTLLEYDEEHCRPARVATNLTMDSPVKVTMFDLTVGALRYNPALIIPAEVRDGAVYQAMSAGQTGHTILTSFHSNGAKESYRRLVSLCHMANVNQPDQVLLQECVSIWPIIVYMEQLKDNTRCITEIYEATGVKNGQVIGRSLYKFKVDHTMRDGLGHITKVVGKHVRTGCISPELYQRLWDKGARPDILQRLFPEGKGVEE